MSLNILDRAIAFFSPDAGVRRAIARGTLDTIDRERAFYDGAMVGRRTGGWFTTNASANAITKNSLSLVRARSRDLVRNTWWGARVKSVFVAHAIGTGITPKSNTGNKALDRRVMSAWRDWCATADAEGQLGFNGLTALAAGCIIESGEVLARAVPVPVRGKIVPLELQLLEPDHLDPSRDRVGQTEQLIVDQGIEYDARGKRTGYWLFPEHPGARGIVVRQQSVRVPAANVLHVYRKDRIGQGRGVPWLAPVILKGRDVADLEEAVVVKARIEACLAAFIKTNDPRKTIADQKRTETRTDGSTRRIETLSPGLVMYGEPGEEAQTIAPSSSLQFESVLMTNWLALAAGAGITYDQLTGDLRRANFSSLRAGKIEFRRVVEQFQWLTLIEMFLDPFWRLWTEFAQDAGALPRRAGGYPVEWIMPAVEPIDPLKDMQADILAVRSGRMTWAHFVGMWGLDPEAQLDEIGKWFEEIDRRKIVLDTDPRLALASTKGGGQGEAQTEENTNVKTAK